MSDALAGIGSFAARGWSWWGSELASMLPGFGHAHAKRHTRTPLVALHESGTLKLVWPQRRKGPFSRRAGSTGGDDLERLGRTRPGTKVHLRLPATAVLERSLEIPASAQSQAPAILALDLERSTPFRARDVFIGYELRPLMGRKGWLAASQLVAKRKTVDEAIMRLREYGLVVDSIGSADPSGEASRGIEFRDGALATSSSVAGRGRLPAFTALMTLVLVGSAFTIAVWRREAALELLDGQVASVRLKAETVRKSTAAAETKSRQWNALRSLKSSKPAAVAILNELTRLLPDDVVLNEVKLDGETVTFSGRAKSAAAVISLLERSSMFRDAALTAPVSFDAAAEKESVNVSVHLRRAIKAAAVEATVEAGSERAQ